MRQRLLSAGAKELKYEIRGIVKKAEQVQALGQTIYWENIGDPIQKHNKFPAWMTEILIDLLKENETYGYSHSKGVLETREYLAAKTNEVGGVQISSDDILFFNGLGDAISKLYQYLLPTSRVIGPSPAYSTHSSAEGAHANDHPLTYKLDPANNWYPDLDDLYNKVKYNPNIVGILIINPDNPTGMVYPEDHLRRIVEIAREFNLFLISDEIYLNIAYNGAKVISLAEVIDEIPGIALRGISKEMPWPGARCGWMEFYNRNAEKSFNRLCNTLEDAKMIEVCSTKLPQLAIPRIMSDSRYLEYREELNEKIGKRSTYVSHILGNLDCLYFNETYGAFYNTIIFKDGVLKPDQTLKIKDLQLRGLVESWIAEEEPSLDSRFIYYMLAAKGVCAVPVSSFSSDLLGFRITLLEEDEQLMSETFTRIREAVLEYVDS